jgi:hypothetical protein
LAGPYIETGSFDYRAHVMMSAPNHQILHMDIPNLNAGGLYRLIRSLNQLHYEKQHA